MLGRQVSRLQMLVKLAFKNILSRKSSVVIVLFMAFSAALLSVANAVFDSTEQGVESSFISSFTGDFIIRPVSDVPLSLFGDETPVTGELTEIERVIPYNEIMQELQMDSDIVATIPQVTGVGIMEHGGNHLVVSLFGVSAKEYVSAMTALHIKEGQPYSSGQKGMMISEKIAATINAKVGDTVQFTVADGPSFRIRAATVTAIFTYETDNAIFERFVLVDPDVVRSIMDISDTTGFEIEIEEDKTNLLADDLDMDELFDFASDVDAAFDTETDIIEEQSFVEDIWQSNADVVVELPQESSSWNFIICRLKNGSDAAKKIKSLNRIFRRNDWPVQAVNWRNAAGSTALYLYWMRAIFNAGILIVLAAGFIVVNNTLVINVLDRTREIGTMRAVGSSRLFVSLQCMLETSIMSIMSAALGCFLGWLAIKGINAAQITFTNSFLIQLFGSSTFVAKITGVTLGKILLLMLLLGVAGWIYPVATALKISPIKAMQGAK